MTDTLRQRGQHRAAHRLDGDLGNHLLEEAAHDHPLGFRGIQAARLRVEALDGVDRTRGCPVPTAQQVVGLDLEHRDRLRAGGRGEEQVAAFLVAARLPRGLLDARDAVEGGARLVVERREVEQVRGRVVRDQVLEAVDINVLLVARRQQSEQQAGAALAGHAQVESQLGDPRADLGVQGGDRGVAADLDALCPDVPDAIAQALQIRVADARPGLRVNRDRAPEPSGRAVRRDELLEQGHAAGLIGDDQGVGQEGHVRGGLRDPCDERAVHLEAARHVQEGASRPAGQREGPEGRVRGNTLAATQVGAHQVGMLAGSRGKIGEHHAALGEPRVGKLRAERRLLEQNTVARQILQRGAAPLFLEAGGKRRLQRTLEPRSAQLAQPIGLVMTLADSPDRRRVERQRPGFDHLHAHRSSRPPLPSGAGSGGSSRPRTPSAVP